VRPVDARYTLGRDWRVPPDPARAPAAWEDRPLACYGERWRFGPYHRQAVRFVGRTLERLGAWLDSWSWGWR
jgi:hypothetical protein